ncbi:hypothetical protein NHQ30_009867 [Ciborinia camelliae]|nr:hypothetical protein NHQ30_009867 [Ciborinia camelliae]
MALATPDAPEKLVFDTNGDVLFIFTRSSEGNQKCKESPSKSASLKRKAPDDTSKTVTMLVSSKHMKLASPVFNAVLGDNRFKEGAELLAEGKIEIELPEDDPTAFSIMAQVIHGRNYTVSKHVTFELLLELAILTDKYQTHEILGCISDIWVENLLKHTSIGPRRPSFTPATMESYIFIVWVFRENRVFSNMTKLSILKSDETFGSHLNNRFYLPPSLIDAIKLKRAQAFVNIFAALSSFAQRGIEPKSYCKDSLDVCDLITTGSFQRSASLNGCWPVAAPPYAGLTVEKVFQKIMKIKVRHWCGTIVRDGVYASGLPDPDCINRKMFTKMNEVQIKVIKSTITGLEIKGFQHEPKGKSISLPNSGS